MTGILDMSDDIPDEEQILKNRWKTREDTAGEMCKKSEPLGSCGNALTAGKVPRSINHLLAAAAAMTVALFWE